MKKIDQKLIDYAIEQRERTLRTSAYTLMGIGMAGMLFFMYLFLVNQVGKEVEAYLIGFIFTSLVFAFGVANYKPNITRESVEQKYSKNNLRK